jgi:hypothetical protein
MAAKSLPGRSVFTLERDGGMTPDTQQESATAGVIDVFGKQ